MQRTVWLRARMRMEWVVAVLPDEFNARAVADCR